MDFQLDRIGFARAVERVLPAASAAEGAGAGSARTKWKNAGWYVVRACLSPAKWEQLLRRRRLRFGIDWIQQRINASAKPVLVYVVPYDIVQLQAGGGVRIAGMAKALSRDFNVFILTLRTSAQPFYKTELAPDVALVGIPEEEEFDVRVRGPATRMAADCGRVPPLLAVPGAARWLPGFHSVTRSLANRAQVWILVSPLAWGLAEEAIRAGDACVVYDAHDDILHFLDNAFQCTNSAMQAAALAMEQQLLARADRAVFCTEDDRQAAIRRNPDGAGKMQRVPNGVDTGACNWVPPVQARQRREAAGLSRHVAVFAGSHHRPNYEAVNVILRDIAPAFPDWIFVILGMHWEAYRKFAGTEPGENVVMTGPVSEELKETIFSLADIALAPMQSGTGSSLKIPDYIAHGKIVLGTPVSFRGIQSANRFSSVAAADDLVPRFRDAARRLAANPDEYTAACAAARAWVQAELDWTAAVRPLAAGLALNQKKCNPVKAGL